MTCIDFTKKKQTNKKTLQPINNKLLLTNSAQQHQSKYTPVARTVTTRSR